MLPPEKSEKSDAYFEEHNKNKSHYIDGKLFRCENKFKRYDGKFLGCHRAFLFGAALIGANVAGGPDMSFPPEVKPDSLTGYFTECNYHVFGEAESRFCCLRCRTVQYVLLCPVSIHDRFYFAFTHLPLCQSAVGWRSQC